MSLVVCLRGARPSCAQSVSCCEAVLVHRSVRCLALLPVAVVLSLGGGIPGCGAWVSSNWSSPLPLRPVSR